MARLTKEFKEIPGYPGIYINNREIRYTLSFLIGI